MSILLRQTWIAIRVIILGTVVLGLIYPLAVMGVGQVATSGSANGSLIRGADGSVVGSALIGQTFDDPKWFHSRPSAAGTDGYGALSSSATNLGPNNEDLLAEVEERKAAAVTEDGPGVVPPDALTASGSGLDPHITPEYASRQVARIAKVNKVSESTVAELVSSHTDERMLGYLGERRVNVLELNIALLQLVNRAS